MLSVIFIFYIYLLLWPVILILIETWIEYKKQILWVLFLFFLNFNQILVKLLWWCCNHSRNGVFLFIALTDTLAKALTEGRPYTQTKNNGSLLATTYFGHQIADHAFHFMSHIVYSYSQSQNSTLIGVLFMSSISYELLFKIVVFSPYLATKLKLRPVDWWTKQPCIQNQKWSKTTKAPFQNQFCFELKTPKQIMLLKTLWWRKKCRIGICPNVLIKNKNCCLKTV